MRKMRRMQSDLQKIASGNMNLRLLETKTTAQKPGQLGRGRRGQYGGCTSFVDRYGTPMQNY